MFGGFRNCGGYGAGRGGWGFGPGAEWWMGGRPGRHRGHRGGRFFEQGDLKYVILQLLAEKPRHGYDIIKELEEKFGGSYAPSAGTVYPTLQLLEDLGYASVSLEEGGKKIFSITAEGRRYLEENKPAVDEIFERIADYGASFMSEPVVQIHRAYGNISRAIYAPVMRYYKDKEMADKVRQIIDRAAEEIRQATGTAEADSKSV